jgi:hypothetical protein
VPEHAQVHAVNLAKRPCIQFDSILHLILHSIQSCIQFLVKSTKQTYMSAHAGQSSSPFISLCKSLISNLWPQRVQQQQQQQQTTAEWLGAHAAATAAAAAAGSGRQHGNAQDVQQVQQQQQQQNGQQQQQQVVPNAGQRAGLELAPIGETHTELVEHANQQQQQQQQGMRSS